MGRGSGSSTHAQVTPVGAHGMPPPKPLKTYWSKAAYDFAGDAIAQTQQRLLVEAGEIAQKAAGWFLHVVQRDGEGSDQLLLCRGQEEEETWIVLVQLGEMREIEPDPGGEPLAEIMGLKPRMPRVLEGEDNERFAEIALPPQA